MMQRLLLLCFAFITCAAVANGQATLTITVPADTPPDWNVYVAGTFNDWQPDVEAYIMTRQNDGTHSIELPAAVRGAIQFKFTVGSWNWRELSSSGSETNNRSLFVPATGTATYSGTVQAWSNWTWPLPGSRVSPNVSIVDKYFDIPQLERSRRVWIYLPPDYHTSTKNYPVSYLTDGQYSFDMALSSDEIGVDEALDAHYAAGWEVGIVVAIDRPVFGTERLQELLPWRYAPWDRGGDGALFAEFLVDNLKPYIDANYRTNPGRESTSIMGVSAGGLFATWTAITYPEVFSAVLAGSPAYFLGPEIYEYAANLDPVAHPTRFALVSGLQEDGVWGDPEIFADGQKTMVDALLNAGVQSTDISHEIHPDGNHTRTFWSREFPDMYRWLFGMTSVDREEQPSLPSQSGMDVYPNPGAEHLQVRVSGPSGRDSAVQLFEVLGREIAVSNQAGEFHRFQTGHLAPGMYLVRAGARTSRWIKR